MILEALNIVPKKILWVDDDEDFTSSFRPTLEKEGGQVETAASAEEGKSLAVSERPDLIIMDIIMEGEHGYKAIKDLMSRPQFTDVPTIVFSSLTRRWGETAASREDALLSEADVLVGTIRKYLGM